MLSVLFISLSKSVFKHSLSQKVSLLSKKLLLLSLTLLFLWSYNNGTIGKSELWPEKKQADGVWKVENSAQLLFTYIQADTHDIWTQLLILRRNEADAQKYLHSTLIAYQRVERTSEEVQASSCKLFVPFLLLPLSLPRRKKNSISTILLSFSLFCLFVTPTFLLPFPRSSASAFTGRAILAGITRTIFSCALAMSLPSPGHALRIRSTAPILDWISTRLFRMPTWKEPERTSILMNAWVSFCSVLFVLLCRWKSISITPGVM